MSIAKLFILTAVVASIGVKSDTGVETISAQSESDEATDCANEFLAWCRNRNDNSSNDNGVWILSEGHYRNNQRVVDVCISNLSGINCTKNHSPWFFCHRNGTLDYKGKELTPGFKDDDLCNAKDHAKRMSMTTTFDHKAFEQKMKSFEEMMNNFRRRMRYFGRGFSASSGSTWDNDP